MNVQFVEPRFIISVWEQVKPYIESALEHTDDYNADQVKVFLTTGSWILVVAVDENKIHGMCTVAIQNEVNNCTALITTIAGRGIINKDVVEQFFHMIKSNGVTRIQGYSRDSLVKLYKKVFNMQKKANLVELRL